MAVAYKDVTKESTVYTKNGIFVAFCDVVCIPHDGSFYDYIVHTIPWDRVDGDIKDSIESFAKNDGHIALSCAKSKVLVMDFDNLEHFDALLDGSNNNNKKISIHEFPLQEGQSGKYRIFFKESSKHGVYRVRASGSAGPKDIVVEKTPEDVVVVHDAKSIIHGICSAPAMPDVIARHVVNAVTCDVPRSPHHELISSISFALLRSSMPLNDVGSLLRGVPADLIGDDFSRYLWGELVSRSKEQAPDWEDLKPVRHSIDKLMYYTWVHNEAAYKCIHDRFMFKKNYFDSDDPAEYMDRAKISNSTVMLYDVLKWISGTIAYIISGGNGFWVTKNFDENGCMYIERSKDISRDLRHTINAVVDTMSSDRPNIMYCKLSQIVMKYKDCVSFGKLVFVPYSGKEEAPVKSHKHFNKFVGYPVKYRKGFVVDLDILHLLFYHVRHVLADGDAASFEYIVYWMAHIIQRPRDRTGVCLTFTSVQGAGKGIWWEWFGKRIIGTNQYLFLDSIENLFNRFNSEQEGRLFTVLDEAQLYSVQRKNNDRFKSALTESTLRIEPKGLPVYTVTNYNNFVMLTNQDLPVRVDVSDRRHACFQVSDHHKGDTEYFRQLVDCQNNPEVVEHFYHFLEDLPLGNFKPQAWIPETQLKKDLKIASMPTPIMFLIDLVKGDTLTSELIPRDVPSFVTTDHLYSLYKSWAVDNQSDSKVQFSRVISTNLHIEQSHGRIENRLCRGYKVSLRLLSQKLQSRFGEDVLY